MKWNVYDGDNWLGTIRGENEADALAKARIAGMPTATRVERRDE